MTIIIIDDDRLRALMARLEEMTPSESVER
jgi:hypothetical protein